VELMSRYVVKFGQLCKRILVVIGFLIVYPLSGESEPSIGQLRLNGTGVTTNVIVAYSTIVMPLDAYVLIKRGKVFGAVRFTSYKVLNDAKEPTVLTSGEATRIATYECYVRTDGVQSFHDRKYSASRGTLSAGPVVGIGRWGLRKGTSTVKCGVLRLPWFAPTGLGFEVAMNLDSADGTMFAPTALSGLEGVDGSASCLRWYAHSKPHPPTEITAADLCK